MKENIQKSVFTGKSFKVSYKANHSSKGYLCWSQDIVLTIENWNIKNNIFHLFIKKTDYAKLNSLLNKWVWESFELNTNILILRSFLLIIVTVNNDGGLGIFLVSCMYLPPPVSVCCSNALLCLLMVRPRLSCICLVASWVQNADAACIADSHKVTWGTHAWQNIWRKRQTASS